MKTANIRKRGQESLLQKACREESPEKQNKKSRNFKSMTGAEAAEFLVNFFGSKPADPEFHTLATSSTHAIKQFRRGLTDPATCEEYAKNIIESGLLAPIFFLLDLPRYFGDAIPRSTISVLQFEAVWTLTNIASGDGAKAVMEYKDSLDILGRALSDKSTAPNVKEQAIWCIANLAGYEKGDEGRLRLHSTQILRHPEIVEGLLHNTLHPDNASTLKTSLWAIGNVILGRPSPESQQLLEAILQTQNVALLDKNIPSTLRDEILSETYSSLRKAMLEHSDIVKCAGKSGAFVQSTVGVLKQARQSGNGTLVYRVVRCLGLLLQLGDDETIETITKHSFLVEAYHLLQHPNQHILQEVCAALAAFLRSADVRRMKKFRGRGCLTGLVDVAKDSSFKVKKEALTALLHFLSRADQHGHRHFFATPNATQVLCDSLKTGMETDAALCRLALDAVETVLKMDLEHDGELSVCEKLREHHGFENIERIQSHHMKDVAQKAVNVIEEYFVSDENEAYDLDFRELSTCEVNITENHQPCENRSSLIS